MPTKSTKASSLSPEYVCLGFLLLSPSHGYELHQQLVRDLGQVWHIHQNQTYNLLRRLEQQGFITRRVIDQEKLPARSELSITDSGKKHFMAWLTTPTGSSSHAIRVELITRLYFSDRLGLSLGKQLLQTQTETVQRDLTRLQEELQRLPAEQTYNRLGLELRVRQLCSVVAWLEDCWKTLKLVNEPNHYAKPSRETIQC